MTAFFVAGNPAPQGSKSAFVRGGRAVMVESSKRLKPWREAIAKAAAKCFDAPSGPSSPIELCLTFHLPTPKKPRRTMPTSKPDIDKLTRAVCDALTGVVYHDDSQVVSVTAHKRYAIEPGVLISVVKAGND